MIIIDTGPLVALADKGQGKIHQKCVEVIQQVSDVLVTTWPCVTEAMYLLNGLRGWQGQKALWRYLESEELTLHLPTAEEWKRVRELMEQYSDTPMDFADGSLVALAEARNEKRIFTLDSDFFVYRINGKENFEVILPTV